VNTKERQDLHVHFMMQAIELARRGIGLTKPNPPVAALIVSEGKIIGKGLHKRAGGPHAEIFALRSAGRFAKGAVLYVTLEPCSTHGRTGPCTQAIIQSKVKTVVIAARDPNPLHNGRGIQILRKAGINVIEGVCRQHGADLIKPFEKWISCGHPFLTLKLAMSIDGKIADSKGSSRWISSEKSRKAVMNLRKGVDAILVGAGTARTDNPSLLCARKEKPFRVVVDSRGILPVCAKLLNDPYVARTVIATTARCADKKFNQYLQKGAIVWRLPCTKSGLVSLDHLFAELGRLGVLHVLCEGGGALAYSLIAQKQVDEYLFFVAPLIIGGSASVPAIAGQGWLLKSAPRLIFKGYEQSGADIMIRAVPCR